MSVLTIEHLSKTYGTKRALADFSAHLPSGIYGLLGANGAGKTTLMNIIAGNLTPDSGSVAYEGVSDIRPILGFMPQQQALYDSFSARNFLYYIASLKGIKKPGEQIEHLLDVVNLKDAAHRKLKTFSGGMKQRALLAQALLGNPRLLLLDEPTAGLDPMERIRIRNFISLIASDKVVLIATHVVSDVEFIARRILLLRAGQLLGDLSPQEWTGGMEGLVHEVEVAEEAYAQMQSRYMVSNVLRHGDGLILRVLGEDTPPNATPVRPTMEDVYLHAQGRP